MDATTRQNKADRARLALRNGCEMDEAARRVGMTPQALDRALWKTMGATPAAPERPKRRSPSAYPSCPDLPPIGQHPTDAAAHDRFDDGDARLVRAVLAEAARLGLGRGA